MNGIGKKRNLEILRLLYSLPFDFKQKPFPVNPSGDGLLGVHPDLKEYLTKLFYDRQDQTFTRGLAYYRENRVKSIELLHADKDQKEYVAYVKGSRQYKVSLLLDGVRSGEECSCPAFKNYYGYGLSACKHIVAAALALAEKQRLDIFQSDEGVNPAYRQLERTLKSTMSDGLSIFSGKQELDYMLVRANGNWTIYPRKIYPQLKSFLSNNSYYYSYNSPLDELTVSNSRDELIINCLYQIFGAASSYRYNYQSKKAGAVVSEGELLDLMQERDLYVKLDKNQRV